MSLENIIHHSKCKYKEAGPLDNNFMTLELHEEFAKRMEEEHKRQNHRITDLEELSKQNNQLLISVNKLASSMENMQKELTKQGGRLEILESRDGNKWRQLVSHGLTVLVTVLVTYALRQIGIV